jgi:hypothetical protein
VSYKHSIVRRLALAAAALTISVTAAGTAAAADRHVNVVNATNHTMTRFYASNISDPRFHSDILGSDVLRPGSQWRVNFDDGTGACLFDVKAVFSDGEEVTQSRFNVCTETTMRFTGD